MPNIITTSNALFAAGQLRAAYGAERGRGFARSFRRICEYFMHRPVDSDIGRFVFQFNPSAMYAKAEDLKRPNLSLGMAVALIHFEDWLTGNWPSEYLDVTEFSLVGIDGWSCMVPRIEVTVDMSVQTRQDLVGLVKYLDELTFWLRGSPLNQVVWESLDDPDSEEVARVKDKILQYVKTN